ncbi:MAG: nucleotidyltransferase [Anaerolineae bacterium]
MPIPEYQLSTWSNIGATASAEATHHSIRNALEQSAKLSRVTYEAYLQGSYRNSTNIRGDSDVDLVVQLNSSFQGNTSGLSPEENNLFNRTFSDATYGWSEFRADVLEALRSYYGSTQVEEGKKTLKVKAGSGRLPADVVVCMQYRKYKSFRGLQSDNYVEGMTFYVPSENRWVINYPKVHYDNGAAKNQYARTRGQYKPVIRMFKNTRSYLIQREKIEKSLAPSYYIECLLYNVPDRMFEASFQNSYYNVVKWLQSNVTSAFVCQNEQLGLFGPEAEQWTMDDAYKLNTEYINLWNNWS